MNRLTMEFSDIQIQSMLSMAQHLATNKGGVLKTALPLLKVAIDEHLAGNRLAVIDKDGKVIKEIVGIIQA